MREIILGTAGHVDHGKTSLIRALTNIDTDRLKEEKERGITIELGFAHLDLPCGHRLGIVDVPGHEKFVRNMVAGAAGMDLVAFIIAADEGIMPQTREHFDICRLLGVRDGLVILTKKDMVEEEWLEMVEEEVQEFFTGSFLEEAPIIAVDSISGKGIDQVIAVLDKKVQTMQFQEEFGPFRLAVDRVFSMKGFGTVITGSSFSGRIDNGAELRFYPGKRTARIRGIQVHGQEVEMVEAGHRTAINLQGVEKEEINRGDMAAPPGAMEPTRLLDASLHYLEINTRDLKHRTLVRVHVGTREVMGHVLLMAEDLLSPGTDTHIQLLLKEPVAVWPGDHYVIRSYSPVSTIGGGTILNTAPPKRKRSSEAHRQKNYQVFATLEGDDVEAIMLLLLEESGLDGIAEQQMGPRLGLFGKRLQKQLQQPVSQGKIVVVESESRRMLAAVVFEALCEKLLTFLDTYHTDNPLKSGIGREELRSRLRPPVDNRLFQFTLNTLARKEHIEQDGAEVRRRGHTVTLQIDEEEVRQKVSTMYEEAGLKPPLFREVLAAFDHLPEKQVQQVIDLLRQKGVLVRISESLFFHAGVLEKLAEKLTRHLEEKAEIDAQGFKELTGLTRKFSIPLMEYFDRAKLTIRIGDKRVLRKS
ncbi:MAG: selenocysteine-specific translation elongation factor [Deltaproteobacteria bacterium]|nr:MAG: selenocysteine-specific translation elongation factor [Deltaproteobacteria bacterium]